MNIQGYQGMNPGQQLLQQQQLNQKQNTGTQLQFSDLFQSINNSIGQQQQQQQQQQQVNDGGMSSSQLLAQTLYQGQYRSQTPQQRTIQPHLPLQQQQQQQQHIAHHSIPLEPSLAMLAHWQDQLQLVELARKSNKMTHFYARHAAIASRRAKQGAQQQQQQYMDLSLVEVTKQLLDADHNQQSMDSNQLTVNSALLQHKKTSHDTNENDDDIDDYAVPRITSKQFPDQLWGGLDLSGQSIPNLSPNMFKYEFLSKLYLNGNKLSVIPKEIKNLKYLRVLDLSNNSLTSVPPEMGLLFNLKYLYLFDNNLSTLPWEFGNLFELNFLGIEGNPMFNMEFTKIIAQKGTKSLITYLRDNVNNSITPPKRQWIELSDDGEPTEEPLEQDPEERAQQEKESFTVLNYNILCQHYATAKMYSYTPSWALNWEYRRESLKKQILETNADIICLQEVETQSFEDYWLVEMAKHGYRGIFHAKYRARRMQEKEAKKVDGCATFYKYSKFSLAEKKSLEYTQIVLNSQRYKKSDDVFNRLQSRDNIGLVTVFTHLETGQNVLVANTHLHWDPALNDVKTVQVGVLVEEIELMIKKMFKSNDDGVLKNVPVLICGDFNSQLHSAVYKLLADGFCKGHDDVKGRDYGKFTEDGFSHKLNLRSAYDNIGELPFTNFTPSFTDVLDYIWYTPSNMSVSGLLGKIDTEYLSHYVGFPNAHLPSDHVPLLTRFHLKQKRETRRDFKADFRTSRKT